MSSTENSTSTASVSVTCDPTLDASCSDTSTSSPVQPEPPQHSGPHKIPLLAWIALGANATEFIAALATFFDDIYDKSFYGLNAQG